MSTEFYRRQTENQHEKFIVKTELQVQVEPTPPSRYYIVNAFGDYIFLKVRSKATAQKIIDECYGKCFYKIRSMGLDPITGKDVSARP